MSLRALWAAEVHSMGWQPPDPWGRHTRGRMHPQGRGAGGDREQSTEEGRTGEGRGDRESTRAMGRGRVEEAQGLGRSLGQGWGEGGRSSPCGQPRCCACSWPSAHPAYSHVRLRTPGTQAPRSRHPRCSRPTSSPRRAAPYDANHSHRWWRCPPHRIA